MPKRIPPPGTRRSREPWRPDRFAPRRTFLIICEGANTEPNYFRCFKSPRLVVEVDGTGKNTLGLIEETITLRDQSSKETTYDECWCVFDRDSFPVDHFNNAVAKAESAGFSVAYSNQAFELWYLLHFDYCDSALHRSSYGDRLTKRLGRKYEKSERTSMEMYGMLRTRVHEAIANAKRLQANYSHETPEQRDPYTTVHVLVERLLENAVR